jgi:hypothetical protein
MSLDGMQKLFGLFARNYNDQLEQIPFENRPDNTRFLKDEFSYFTHFCRYYISGRNIFSISPDLVEKFYHSDTTGINVSDLRYPYKSFYLAFGIQDNLNLWNNGYFVDGAYISVIEDKIMEIVLSSKRKDIDYESYDNFIVQDKYFYFSIETDEESLSIEEAVNRTLNNDSLYQKYQSSDTSGIYDINGRVVNVVDVSTKSNEIDLQLRLDGVKVFKESLNLIFNTLCFITAYPDKTEVGFPDDCPKEVIQQENKHKKSNLNPMDGFTRIKFIGNRYQHNSPSLSEYHKQTHWRRGHWRNQACGPDKTDHKLLWIMPTIVNRRDNEEQEQTKGHIYDV